jgi:hypothetical protein
LDVTCYDGDGFNTGDNSIKGNDACVDVSLDDRDVFISGNDGISNDGEGVISGVNNNNNGNEGNAGNDVNEVKDGDIGNDGNNRFEYTSDMPFLKQRNHPSQMNSQTFNQPPNSKETAKPNEKSSPSGRSTDSSPFDNSTNSNNSNSDRSQSNIYKRLGIAELLPEKDSSPMIKGMGIMASESAKFGI